MSGRWKIKHPSMRPLALEAREILPPGNVTYVWVPRERNAHADRLANEALDAAARGETWSESTSSAALEVQAAAGEPEEKPGNTLVGWDAGLGTPTTFLLLRHGETDHSVQKKFSGSGGEDPPLSPTGVEQAHKAAVMVAARGVTAIVTSPLRRTRQTAEIAAAALRLPVRVVDDLRECAFGEWEGHTFAEVQQRWPAELDAWLRSTAVAPPGGESFDAVQRRVLRARDQVIARYAQGTVLVVSHVTPIKTLVRAAVDAPVAALFRMELATASLSEIQWYAGGTASLRSFSERVHLLD
jgi:probable phosphoglycerate mutase